MKNTVLKRRGYVEILCNYKGEIFKVSVDNEDVDKLMLLTSDLKVTCTHGKYYCYGRINGHQVLAHRHIMGAEKGQLITFLDGNSLNLRRANLEFATRNFINRHKRLQSNNESGYHGVTWCKKHDKWVVRLYKEGKEIYLGAYRDKSEAIKARRKAERKYYPEG